MQWLSDLKTNMRQKANLAACAAGKHRWTDVFEKTEEGTKTWHLCQTCGLTDKEKSDGDQN